MALRLALTAACLVALAGPVAALDGPPADPAPPLPGPADVLTTPPGLPVPPAPVNAAAETDLRADVIFGLPIAARVQARAFRSQLWVEFGGGSYLIFPGVFTGVRVDGPAVALQRDCLQLRPGVTAWYSPAGRVGGNGWFSGETRALTIVSADVDAVWAHRWTDRFHTEAGLKLGLGVGIANGVLPLPSLGLLIGCRY